MKNYSKVQESVHPRDNPSPLKRSPINILKTLYYKLYCKFPNSTVSINKVYFYANKYRALERGYVTGAYEPNDFEFLNNIAPKNGIIIDVGANIGFYTVYALKFFRPELVISVEPSLRELNSLVSNIKLNNVNTDKILLINQACGEIFGQTEMKISTDRFCGANAIGKFYYPNTPFLKTQKVKVTTLDEIVKSHNLNKVDIIKIDVEGAEDLVIDGAFNTLRTFNPILIVEYPTDQLVRYLNSFGYQDISPNNTINNFFQKKVSHNYV